VAESNGSLLPGLWRDSLHVTCGLTAWVHRDKLRAQRSVTSMGKLYLLRGPGPHGIWHGASHKFNPAQTGPQHGTQQQMRAVPCLQPRDAA